MNNYRIRSACFDDVDQLMAIEISAGKAFASLPAEFLSQLPDDIPPHSAELYKTAIAQNGCWVAENDSGVVVGFICTEIITDENTLHISEFDVSFEEQGKGVGKQLLSFVLDYAKQNHWRVTLTTFRDVPWNAPFYRRFGFKEIPEAELGERLIRVLEKEEELGLPRGTRCGMGLLATRQKKWEALN